MRFNDAAHEKPQILGEIEFFDGAQQEIFGECAVEQQGLATVCTAVVSQFLVQTISLGQGTSDNVLIARECGMTIQASLGRDLFR
ncbi:MAG TPA: hypothetical protein DCW87_12695 [Comamonadaceae bacterium]|nr:hypothetical protein [Comamonadaceae bacterium]